MPLYGRHPSKPPAGTPIDWSTGLAQGLRILVPLWESGGTSALDVIGGEGLGFTGSPTWSSSRHGRTLLLSTTGAGAYALALPPNLQIGYPVSIVLRMRWTGVTPGNFNHIARLSSSNSQPVAQIRWNGTNSTISLSSVAGAHATSYTMSARQWTTLVAVYTAAGKKLYADGQLVYTDSNANSAPTYNASQCFFALGSNPVLSNAAPQAEYDFAGVWSRELTVDEAEALAVNPWRIFTPPQPYSLLAISSASDASGAGSVSLAAITVAGSGAFAASASGSVSLGALTPAGSASFAATASGSVALAALTASGSGAFATSATGSVALAGLGAAGGSEAATSGSGSVSLAAMAVAGVGSFEATGSGSITLSPCGASGVTEADTSATGAGDVSLAGLLVEGIATAGPGSSYEGDDVLEALQAWWQDNGADLTADGYLWHVEAPESTELPYAVYFLVTADPEVMTTAGQSYRSTVQFNFHAETGAEAFALAKTLRRSLKGAPLVVSGSPVWHVRPDGIIPPQSGEGRGPDGCDSYIAGITFDIPFNDFD